jgi:hypothetical protein
MKYQVVIRFHACSTDDFGPLLGFEKSLAHALGASCKVDGHTFGSGEFNISVLTYEPAMVLDRIQEVVKKQRPQSRMEVAYRDLASDEYIMLWPPNLTQFHIV